MWPCLPAVIQQGGNVDVNRGEHELQLLRRLHQMYVDRASRGEATNLGDIKTKHWGSKTRPVQQMPKVLHVYEPRSGRRHCMSRLDMYTM